MAIQYELLIGVDALKELSFIDTNVDAHLVAIAILRTQDNEIEPVLGTPLFKKLLADVAAQNVSGYYETLLNDYVVKYLVPLVEIALAPHLNWEIRNKAVGTSSDATITAGDQRSVYGITETINKEAQPYKRRLVGWLCDNADNLPEYTEGTTDKEEIAPDHDTGSSLDWGFIG